MDVSKEWRTTVAAQYAVRVSTSQTVMLIFLILVTWRSYCNFNYSIYNKHVIMCVININFTAPYMYGCNKDL
jgi:hypothetical protein